MMTDKNAEDGLRWSLTLISKILGRTILEGSTIVMKSTNTNQEKALKKAISVWPSGKRAMVLSNMAVGTHSISPLYWSIENGSRVVAKAIVTDLLIFRADRDNYYYGGDELYTRHPEGIQRLCADAAGPFLYDDQSWQEEEELFGFISKSAKASHTAATSACEMFKHWRQALDLLFQFG